MPARRITALSFFICAILALVLLWSSAALAVQAANIAVSKVGTSQAVLVVKGDVTTNVTVDYGVTPGTYSQQQTGAGLLRHEVTLSGLAPDSIVYYRVTLTDSANAANTLTLPEQSFRTARSPGQPFTFAVAGDNRPWSNTAVQPAAWSTVVGQMGQEDIDLAFNVGDLIYGVSTDTLAQNVAKWNGFFAVTTGLTDSAPLYPVIGNHEYVGYGGSRAGYEQEFSLPVNNGADAATYGEHYYSFDNGDTHFVVLSTEVPGQTGLITGAQKAWLENDLAANTSNWTVVLMHRPLFSGHHTADPWVNIANTAGQQNKWDIHNLFVLRGVDIVFQGHDHFYLRHEEDGIQYIITGGGGAPTSVPTLRAGDAYGASAYHHVKVDETANALRATAITSAGVTLESFTIGVPELTLTQQRTYWESYSAYVDRILSVDYEIANNGPGDASALEVDWLTATNGVSPASEMPLDLVSLAADASVIFTGEYAVPEGVSVFTTTTYVSCNDLGGQSYVFPGPAPVF